MIDMEKIEPNSHKYRNEKKDREALKPVVSKDAVVSTKKPLGKKIADTFITEEAESVKSWLLLDVIIPGIKNTILDMMGMMFFGETNRSRDWNRRRERREYGRISYGNYYGSPSRASRRRDERDEYFDKDDKVDYRHIILKHRDEAERVIEQMRRRIKDCGSVTVADLLELIDVPGKYTDNNYGWEDERDIGLRRVSSGYLIDVTEPRYLD